MYLGQLMNSPYLSRGGEAGDLRVISFGETSSLCRDREVSDTPFIPIFTITANLELISHLHESVHKNSN